MWRLLPPRKCAGRAFQHDDAGARLRGRSAPRTARHCRRRCTATSYRIEGAQSIRCVQRASPAYRRFSASRGPSSTAAASDEQRAADGPGEEHRDVAFADRDGAAELLLRQRPEDQTQHRRHERNVVDAHRAADRADDVEETRSSIERFRLYAPSDASTRMPPKSSGRGTSMTRAHTPASGRFSTSSMTLPM